MVTMHFFFSFRKRSLFLTLLVKDKLLKPLWKAVWHYIIRLKIWILYDPAITMTTVHPDIWLKNLKIPFTTLLFLPLSTSN